MAEKKEFKLETVKKLGVIRENEKSTVELRVTSANGVEAYDLRSWWTDDEGVEKCGKGIRLTKEELDTLVKLVKKIK